MSIVVPFSMQRISASVWHSLNNNGRGFILYNNGRGFMLYNGRGFMLYNNGRDFVVQQR